MASESPLHDATNESDIHDSKKRENNTNYDNRAVVEVSQSPKSTVSNTVSIDPAKSSDIFYVWAIDGYEDKIKRKDLFESLKLLKFTSQQIRASIDGQNILEEKTTVLTMEDHVNVMRRLIEKYNLSVPSYNKPACYPFSGNETTHFVQEIHSQGYEYSHILSYNHRFPPCQTYYYRYSWWYLLKNGVPLINYSVIDAVGASSDTFIVEGDRTPIRPHGFPTKESIANASQSIEKLINGMEYKDDEFEKLLKTERTWWVICGWCRIFKCSSNSLRLVFIQFLNTCHRELHITQTDPPVVNMDNYISPYLKVTDSVEEYEQRLLSLPVYKSQTTFELLCMYLKFSPYLNGSIEMIHQIILDGELLSVQVGEPVITVSDKK